MQCLFEKKPKFDVSVPVDITQPLDGSEMDVVYFVQS